MDAFIDRFYADVRESLADPHIQKRLTEAQLYRQLCTVQREIWEQLLKGSGRESTIGRTEATITLQSGVSFYPLPGNFRREISFLKYLTDGDRDQIEKSLRSIGPYSDGPGFEILTANRGMEIRPTPMLSASEPWTLVYQKGPVRLHHATSAVIGDLTGATFDAVGGWTSDTTYLDMEDYFTAHLVGYRVTVVDATDDTTETRTITAATNDRITFAALSFTPADGDTITFPDADFCWLTFGTPAAGDGELIKMADYYNGSLVRVYSATDNWPQTRECIDYYLEDGLWVAVLRHHWTGVPTGTVLYEIAPEITEDLDKLYGYKAAIQVAGPRGRRVLRQQLISDYAELWKACKGSFADTTMDRGPRRIHPPRGDRLNPYEGAS